MAFAKDIWRPAIVDAPMDKVVEQASLDGFAIHPFPEMPPFQFLADPFGLWRDGQLHIFAERLDYRDKRGRIEWLCFDGDLQLTERAIVLEEPWHLSYPFVIEAEDEIWMLPEAARSGRLTLYRCVAFPDRWEAAATLDVAGRPIDATPFFHDGRWWLIYRGDAGGDENRGLCLAHANKLEASWTLHPASPLAVAPSWARPGGTPFVLGRKIIVPIQDGGDTYGGGIRLMTISRLSPEDIDFTIGPKIVAPQAATPYVAGFHTLSAAGGVTLIDSKRIVRSLTGVAIDLRRSVDRWRARRHSPASAA